MAQENFELRYKEMKKKQQEFKMQKIKVIT